MKGGRWSDKYDYEENYGETAGQLEISVSKCERLK